jgi:hypothetical protein
MNNFFFPKMDIPEYGEVFAGDRLKRYPRGHVASVKASVGAESWGLSHSLKLIE